jgi:hypothetical protein
MIKTSTLFILGAGASKPFDYPTGDELRHQIFFNEEHENGIVKAYNTQNDPMLNEMHRSSHAKFKQQFGQSGDYSIDSFLEHRSEYMDIGKMYIAKILMSHEQDKNLRQTDGNWYMYLFNRMKISFEELSQNRISFITFNYDRSLEYFLFEAIKNKFGKGSSECAEKMKSFPIVHLYGQLDPLPWQEAGGKEYSSEGNILGRLIAAPKNIKLISNERDIENSQEFKDAYKLIEKAEHIFFLGFSFDEINLNRLDVGLMGSKRIIASAFKLESTKSNWVKRYFQQRSCSIGMYNDLDALSLLQNHLTI